MVLLAQQFTPKNQLPAVGRTSIENCNFVVCSEIKSLAGKINTRKCT